MMRVSFDDFNKKNKDKTTAFEIMCRKMFLRYFKKTPTDYRYDFNNRGLEIHPFKSDDDGKWYGLQCKYFQDSTHNTTRFKQIYDSVEKAITYYKKEKESLDCIYIYTNSNFKDIDYQYTKQLTRLTYKHKIVVLAHENNVKLEWIKTENILDNLYTRDNYDLLRTYFKDSNEIEFLSDSISEEEHYFLNSSEYIDLKINNGMNIDVLTKFDDSRISILIGDAGTGKSLILKKLFLKYSQLFFNTYFNKDKENKLEPSRGVNFVPIFIKLGLCVNGDLEHTIRKKIYDFNIKLNDGSTQYIYLLDGIDEVPSSCLWIMIEHIQDLLRNSKIIISSRTDSLNYLTLLNSININDNNIFKIDYIDDKQIEEFFKAKKNESKKERINNLLNCNKSLVREIHDILSLQILYENVEVVDVNDTKISLLKLSIYNTISQYSKLNELEILHPKADKIVSICKEIAYEMQRKGVSTIDIRKTQELIAIKFNVYENNKINMIISSLCDMFMENSNNKLIFKHRRYHEYFLFLFIKELCFDNPSIFRQLNLLTNKDFIINIF